MSVIVGFTISTEEFLFGSALDLGSVAGDSSRAPLSGVADNLNQAPTNRRR